MISLRAATIAAALVAAATRAPAPLAAQTTAPTPAAHADTALRVMTYNIAAGRFGLPGVAEVIRAADPDLVGLEEVDVHYAERSGFVDQARSLADTLHMRVFFAPIYTLPPLEAGQPPRQFGLAVLSRLPIVATTNHEITRLSTQAPNPSPRPMPGFPEVVVDPGGRRIRFFATHLDYRADPAVRRTQVRETLALLADDSLPTILVGDLNATPDAPEIQPLLARLHDGWSGHSDPGFTYPAEAPRKRIDYVLTSPEFVVRDARVIPAEASDHRAVVVDLVAPARRGSVP